MHKNKLFCDNLIQSVIKLDWNETHLTKVEMQDKRILFRIHAVCMGKLDQVFIMPRRKNPRNSWKVWKKMKRMLFWTCNASSIKRNIKRYFLSLILYSTFPDTLYFVYNMYMLSSIDIFPENNIRYQWDCQGRCH